MAWTAPRTWTDGELVTASIMNTHVRDNELALGPHLVVRKTADESVTSSTVMQADDVLTMAIAANEIWKVEFALIVDAGPGGMDVRWTFPTSGYLSISASAPSNSGAAPVMTGTSPTVDNALGVESAGDRKAFIWSGVFVNSTNAGNLALEFAQTTSNATACIMKANSTLWAVKLA